MNLIKCSDTLDTEGKRYNINKIIYAHKFRAYSISLFTLIGGLFASSSVLGILSSFEDSHELFEADPKLFSEGAQEV